MNFLNVAYYSPKLASVLGGQIARDEDWDFIKNGGDGPLAGVNEKVRGLGAASYNLMRTIGIICLVLCLLCVCISFMIGKAAQDKKENKNWLIWIFIGGAGVFGVFSIVSIIASVGNGI